MSRGLRWFRALTGHESTAGSVRVADCDWDGEAVRVLAVVPNPRGRYPHARDGQIGIEEGWLLARAVQAAVRIDAGGTPRAIVAIVDVPGQAFGIREEAEGLHLSLAAAVDAYAAARRAGLPVVTLVVGKAISGAFLAHGLQAGAILALGDPEVEVHVMSRASVARVTRRSVDEVDRIARLVPATARDIASFAGLGGVDRVLDCAKADRPTVAAARVIRAELVRTIRDLRARPRGPVDRLSHPAAAQSRTWSRLVRERLAAAWDETA